MGLNTDIKPFHPGGRLGCLLQMGKARGLMKADKRKELLLGPINWRAKSELNFSDG